MVRSWKWISLWILLLLLIVGLAARLYLNVWLPRYVNEVINNIDGYQGSIEDITIDLYRGAYKIHHLKIDKKTGHIPVPFIAVETADLSIEWGALFHGRIVSNVDLDKPVINFAISPSGQTEQTGAGVDWTKPIKDLMPIDINLVTFREGTLTYQDFSTSPKVDVYIHHMSGESRNLRNVVETGEALPSTLIVNGDSIGGGKLDMHGRLNILKEVPDMKLETKIENVDLTALNNYTNAYAAIDIRKGRLDVYSEINVKDNQVSGHVKPIATNVGLIDLNRSANPVKVAWEAVVAVIVKIFTNLPRQQFATDIPLSGHLDNIDTQTLPAIGAIIRNAFVEAFKKDFGKE